MVEIVVTIMGKVAELLVAPIGRQFGYLFCYNRNIENMISQVDKIKKNKLEVQEDVEEAIRKCDKIKPLVTEWLKSVDENEVDAYKILEAQEKVGKGCLNGWCPNINSRYLLSREASKKTQKLIELEAKGRFEKVARPSTPRGVVHTCSTVMETPIDDKFGGFESRSLIVRDIMKSFKEDKIRVIGIWGMGGVGKTTLAKEVVERVKKEGAFDEVMMVVVSQKPDLKKIQGDIAELLGLTLIEQIVNIRAFRLHDRLTQMGQDDKPKKILLILDDVWERLDLAEVGIPSTNNCKILLTSRRNDVCYQMGADKTCPIELLTGEEARDLFQKTGGIFPDFLRTIAEQIVDECKGLPIAITTIARVLGNKSESTWKRVLRQLKESALVDKEYAVVYETFQVSYDFLQTKEVQTAEVQDFFLLCCLFPEDFDIPIEDLVKYGVGLNIFRNITKLQDARENSHSHVENLRDSNLLIESSVVGCVKVHDLVRDFALSRACKGEFLVRFGDAMKEWPVKDMNERHTSISLQCNKKDGIPDGLNCPNLKLLRLAGLDYTLLKFPKIFFESMSKLHVLVLTCVSIRSLPSSLQFLSSLRTLSLSNCRFDGDISLIGNLEALELLSFAHSEIQDLPIEIGKLSRLRLLDLTGSTKLNRIAPRILSSLIHLEELYLRGTSIRWAEQIHVITRDGVEKNASFAELKALSSLVVLEIDMSNKLLPVKKLEKFFLEKLEKFYVCVGNINEEEIEHGFENTLWCKVDKFNLVKGVFNVLCRKAKVLDLSVKDLKSLQKEIDIEYFLELRDLVLTSCDDMVSLFNTTGRSNSKVFPKLESLCLRNMANLEHICCSRTSSPNLSLATSSSMNELALFGHLKSVQVTSCRKLRSIFSVSITKGLVNLRELEVVDCLEMEEIFMKDRGEEDKEASTKIVFLCLELLRLHDLPNFVGFCKAADEIELPQLEVLDLKGLPRITSIYSKGDTLDLNFQQAASNHPFFSKKVNTNNLARLELRQMKNLTEIWPVHFRNDECLSKLEITRVESCDNVKNVFPSNIIQGTEIEAAASPLKYVGFHKLRKVEIRRCGRLRNVFPSSIIDGGLVFLEMLCVDDCEMMDAILWKDGREYEAQFPRLRRLHLMRLPNLVHFSLPFEEFKFPQLNYVYLCALPRLDGFASNGVLFNIEQVHNLQSLLVEECDSVEVVFELQRSNNEGDEVPVLTQLQDVLLKRLRNLRHVWRKGGPPHAIIQGGSLHNLTSLKVSYCDSLTHLFTPSVAKLVVGLQGVVQQEEEKESSATCILFHQLTTLILSGVSKQLLTVLQVALDNLETLFIGDRDDLSVFFPTILPNQQLQNLQNLRIFGCRSLEVVFDLRGLDELINNEGHELATTLIKLKRVELHRLPRLTHVWRMGSHAFIHGPFRNLSFLIIDGCSELRHVFTLSIAKLLPGLEKLKISHCEKLEEIVAKEESKDQEEESGIFFLFPRLTQLDLTYLPKLFKITPKPYSLKWSSLKKLDVRNCDNFPVGDIKVTLDNLETLDVCGINELTVCFRTSMPHQLGNLQAVVIKNSSSLEVVFDLGGFVFDNEGRELSTLTQLRRVSLSNLPTLTHVWRNVPHAIQGPFRVLSYLNLTGCGSLRHVFTPSMAKHLSGLEELKIHKCENLEAIVAKEESREEESGIFILFPQLTRLSLRKLPNLLTITTKPYSLNWPSIGNLSWLSLTGSDSLRRVFTPSIAKLVSELENLEILKCENLEAIVAKEVPKSYEIEESGGILILFPQLTTLYLGNLPNLLTITPEDYRLNWSSSFEELDLSRGDKLSNNIRKTNQYQGDSNIPSSRIEEIEEMKD